MEIELIEIRDFIAQHPPFDILDETALNNLPKKLTIRYFRQGSVFPDALVETKSLYIVRTGAIELRNEHEQLIDKLAEGDIYLVDEQVDKFPNKLNGICIIFDNLSNLSARKIHSNSHLFYILCSEYASTFFDFQSPRHYSASIFRD